jgi:hypothetical protein
VFYSENSFFFPKLKIAMPANFPLIKDSDRVVLRDSRELLPVSDSGYSLIWLGYSELVSASSVLYVAG